MKASFAPFRSPQGLGAMLTIVVLSACGSTNIPDNQCTGLAAGSVPQLAGYKTPRVPSQIEQHQVPDEFRMRQAVAERIVRTVAIKSGALASGGTVYRQAIRPEVTLNVLALTTGGQYGAFGSGFLAGWSQNSTDPRPDFDLVTGASAGGIIAPFAFAGRQFDNRLSLNAGIDNADVIKERSIFTLFHAPSIYDTTPLLDRVQKTIDEPLVKQIASRSRDGSVLLVGSTNLESGRLDLFDLGDFVARNEIPLATREKCLEEAIMATSAIPALFTPRHINGSHYVDAGVRQHVFLGGLYDGLRYSRAKFGARPRVNVYLVVNGDLKLVPENKRPDLKNIAERSLALISDEGLRQSLLQVLTMAEKEGWHLRAVTATDISELPCDSAESENMLFSSCITTELFREGQKDGKGPDIPWLNSRGLREKILDF